MCSILLRSDKKALKSARASASFADRLGRTPLPAGRYARRLHPHENILACFWLPTEVFCGSLYGTQGQSLEYFQACEKAIWRRYADYRWHAKEAVQ